MATLQQISTGPAIFIGWYGTCEDSPCVNFPLTIDSVRGKIVKVYQTTERPSNDGYVAFDGTIDPIYVIHYNHLQNYIVVKHI